MAVTTTTVGSAIPQLWAKRLQIALRKLLVYGDCCNRKYEGEIKDIGDSVRIQTVADVALSAYTRNTDISATTLTTTDLVLTIDQGRAFNFKWDDVDDVQSIKGIMAEAMSRAAYLLRDEADKFIAALMVAGVSTGTPDNQLPPATSVGTGSGDDDPFAILVNISTVLDNADVPDNGRWAVIPPWYAGELLKDPRRSSFGTSENLRSYSEGFMGTDQVSGLRLYRSNNVPNSGGAYSIVAGYDDAVTFANQVTKFDTREAPSGFYNYNMGLMVYGGKVVRAYGLAGVVATQAT